MKSRLASLISALVVITTLQVGVLPSGAVAAPLQSITLLGGQTDASHPFGGYSQEADVSWDTATTWMPAYLTNSHPWTTVAGTNAWLSACPRTDDASCLNRDFIFRHRFFVASDFETATITYEMNVDDIGQFFLNGLSNANKLFSPHTGNSTFASHKFGTNQNVQSLLVPGWNTFYVVLTGLSGHVGINYKTVLSYYSVAAPIYQAPVGKPGSPTIGTPSIIDSTTVSVPFSAPASDGGSAITSYRVTSYPRGKTGTSTTSPISISGLTTGSPETFTVVAINAFGTSESSTSSTSITPRDRFTVNFNSQGGSSVSSASYFTNESVTAPSSPTLFGNSFNGWFESTTAGSAVTFPYSNPAPGSFTLYAQWTVVTSGQAPVVVAPPPSIFMVVSKPKILRAGTSYICTSGTYKFKKQGGAAEAPNISSQQISLLSNGSVVDSVKTLEAQSSFESKDSYKETTLSCEIEIKQEEVVATYSSIDRETVASLRAEMTAAMYEANTRYYEDRRAAYEKRDAGDIKLWKEMLENAPIKREERKAQAGVAYLENLEKAGLSILVAADKATPTPTPTPTKPAEVSLTENVQPTAMKKVGTIYFASGTFFLNDESKKTIKALAASISLNSPATVLSYGFTDSKGGIDNTLLSQNRAKAVAKLLRSLLPGQKIAIGWYGSSKPAVAGTSKAALAKNRRVEIYTK
jgi:outer membrane protein OmpA-like peptidoglycan-associated protein